MVVINSKLTVTMKKYKYKTANTPTRHQRVATVLHGRCPFIYVDLGLRYNGVQGSCSKNDKNVEYDNSEMLALPT